jgi:predicted acylesterase/phospholipase RssA
MGKAILASAAISALVLPVRVDGVVATDGGWVRNFPLEHAYRNPEIDAVVAFRYVMRYRPTGIGYLHRVRERLDRFGAVPPVRALLGELQLAEERAERGEPAHYPELIIRLMRVAVARNTVLEERLASERDESVVELQRLRAEVVEAAVAAAPRRRRGRVREELEQRFSEARFPFRHDRHVPRLVVLGDAGDDGLDPMFRADESWPRERKLRLIERGYELTDEELRANPDFPGDET